VTYRPFDPTLDGLGFVLVLRRRFVDLQRLPDSKQYLPPKLGKFGHFFDGTGLAE
jgi:hypothetical protein